MDRRRWLLLALVLVAAVGLGGLQWWRTHPESYFYGGAGMEFEPTPVDRAVSVVVLPRVEQDEPVTVRITSVEPRLVENTARASVELFLCTPPDGSDRPPQIGYGAPDRVIAEECATTESAIGREVTLGDDAETLYYRVAPTRAGRVRMDGLVIRYDVGWQRGEGLITDSLLLRPR